ncbi:thioredoxin family protein [Chitiniphilus purpureus]|uniref:Thioredoxin family protein n=1 Tax=Chitiniphilus purpureus TaxID=2981137 RepID=A0ABY6DKE3_9NEIS|nr:thioredoxin family protein [Chitiniphilus sp. CD1]UXY14814.1 thioredoxin family protein [Chitiniphilus sp. CD1]
MRVTVYGPNTTYCHRAEVVVRQTLKAAGAAFEIETVRDCASLNCTEPPEIAIDGQMVSSGHIPTPAEVLGWLGRH